MTNSSPLLTPEQLFGQVVEWLALSRQPPPPVEPASALAGDARKSPIHRVDHAAWAGFITAIDHLNAVRLLVVDAQALPPYASYSLLRSAIENAATAVWLLAPGARTTRLERRLRLAHNEAVESGKARELRPAAFDGTRTTEERKEKIKDLARTHGLDLSQVCGRFSYEKIVEAAGAAAKMENLAKFQWRQFSGFAHGRYWAPLGLLDRKVHMPLEPNVHAVRLTTSVEQVVVMAHGPVVLARLALDLYERRRRSPYRDGSLA